MSAMSRRTRVAVLGCGQIARAVHLPALRSLPEADVVAFAEADAARRQEVAAELPGATPFVDVESLLAQSDAEAVVICLPTALHAEAAVAAFEAGRHVYLEKPIGLDLKEGCRVAEAGARSGCVGRVGFNFRFNSQVEAARAALRAGRLGDVVAVQTVFSVHPGGRQGWRAAQGQGGDVLLDLASHHVDLVRFLLGDEVSRVSASVRSLHAEADHATLSMTLASGVQVQTFVSHGSVDAFQLALYGTAGRILVDRTGAPGVEITEATFDGARARRIRRSVERVDPRYLLRSPGHVPSFGRALGAFLGAVRSEPDPVGATLEDGLASLNVVAAATEAARSGAEVGA